MDPVSKIEYKLRDLSTRSVTLFPTRAQVSREIKDVPLKPGANEITIVGLTPTVDENSIKVEGIGAAIITDIAVESLPNREIFQEIYPDSDLDSSDSEGDEYEEEETEIPELIEARKRVRALQEDLARASEEVESAESRLQILDAHGRTLDRKRGVIIDEGLETYKQERRKTFEDRVAGQRREAEISDAIYEANKDVDRLVHQQAKDRKRANREKARVQRTKTKERMRLARRKEERIKEKERVRRELQSFWPKYVYSVRVTLDANAYTPMSSRRGSVSSDIDLAKPSSEPPSGSHAGAAPVSCDLLLSYVTVSAYWSPNYDLQLSTTSSTSTLLFDAELHNHTSEAWEDCKITLSTSQATFAGLEDTIPSLTPWRIKLQANHHHSPSSNYVLHSREEETQRDDYRKKLGVAPVRKARAEMFGLTGASDPLLDYQAQLTLLEQQNKKRVMMARQEAAPQVQIVQEHANATQSRADIVQSHSMQTNPAPSRPKGLFVSSRNIQNVEARGEHLRPSRSAAVAAAAAPGRNPYESIWDDEDEECDAALSDGDTLDLEPQPALDFQESLIEETGFTTTYDLPGTRTLVPKSTSSKQRVARVSFTKVLFSHTVVAKYKPVAYLKAKLRNTSKLTLLKGSAGLTLDGTFMGRTTLPRCSAGDSFSLSLGVDPAIKVIYQKPDVRRATSGLLNKQNSSVYYRSVTLENTRAAAGKPVNLLVLDQVPVSEDERLRVELLAPRGVAVGGAGVPTGQPLRESRDPKDWGRSTAVLKKGGEVTWEVVLHAGKGVKLGLEYSVTLPSGDYAVEC